MGLDLLLASMNIPSTGCQFRIKYRAPERANSLLIPADLVVFQVTSGEEALLATQMIIPLQVTCAEIDLPPLRSTITNTNERAMAKMRPNVIYSTLNAIERLLVHVPLARMLCGSKCTFPPALAVLVQEHSEDGTSPYPR